MNTRTISILALFSLVFLTPFQLEEMVRLDVPKPAVFVNFEEGIIRENETVQGTVWLSNDSEIDLADLKLHINAPEYLGWYETSCGGEKLSLPISLGDLAAHTTLKKSLCLQLEPGFDVGTLNLLFIIDYGWMQASSLQKSIVTVEKTMKIDVFGADSLLGIPLAFASFLIPGLFFLLTLQILFKVPFSLNLKADERLIFSVLLSIVIMAASLWIKNSFRWSWIQILDVSQQISITKLMALATAGVFFGTLVGLIYLLYKLYQRNLENQNIIRPTDPMAQVVEKTLQLNRSYNGNRVIVQLKNGEEYIGSHYAKGNGTLYLLGEFQIDMEKLDQETIQKIRKSMDAKGNLKQDRASLLRVLKVLPSDASIDVRGQVKQKIQLEEKYTDKAYEAWREDEISTIIPDGNNRSSLLSLV
jgi:hypothetical protein